MPTATSRPLYRTLLIAVTVGAVMSCANQSTRPAVVAASPLDAERCQAAGHEPGSEGYASCLQMLDLLRRQEALRDQQINNATINAQRRLPAPR